MSLPVEFIKKYQNLLGEEESNKFFAAIDSSSKKGFRLNPLKNNYHDVQYSLADPLNLLVMVIMVEFRDVTVSGLAVMFILKTHQQCIQPLPLM